MTGISQTRNVALSSTQDIVHSHQLTPALTHAQATPTTNSVTSPSTDIPPTANGNASSVNLLFLQVKAFLEAAEDVEVDPETIQELFHLIHDQEPNGDEAHAIEEESEDEEWSPEKESLIDEDELDISALFTREDDGTWSEEESKEMIRYLKERGMGHFVRKYVINRAIPIPKLLLAFGINLCPELQKQSQAILVYFLRVAMWRELRLRERLSQYNTISDAVNLIRNSKRILILTGAGISVSCGIPDFRSRNGLYASLGEYELDDPQQMFDINYFRENPSVFYSFASQIYPSNFVPSPCHRFIKLVEDKSQLLRNYTQNIDTLETVTGVQRVLQCHGSFATASCLLCKRKVPGNEIEPEIMRRKVPLCPVCNPNTTPGKKGSKKKMSKKKAKGEWDSEDEDVSDVPSYPPGIMKPDITFFGEKLTDEYDRSIEEDREMVDLLLVIGTSLKVAPVADILSSLPHSVPQILINKTPVRHINPDIILLGNADDIVTHLCNRLGWELPESATPSTSPQSSSSGRLQPPRGIQKKRSSSGLDDEEDSETVEPRRVGDSHVWLFTGAEGGKWLSELERQYELSRSSSSSSAGNETDSALQTRASSPGTADLRREVKKARLE